MILDVKIDIFDVSVVKPSSIIEGLKILRGLCL